MKSSIPIKYISNRFIRSIVGTLTSTTTPGLSEPESNGNQEVNLHSCVV